MGTIFMLAHIHSPLLLCLIVIGVVYEYHTYVSSIEGELPFSEIGMRKSDKNSKELRSEFFRTTLNRFIFMVFFLIET